MHVTMAFIDLSEPCPCPDVVHSNAWWLTAQVLNAGEVLRDRMYYAYEHSNCSLHAQLWYEFKLLRILRGQ
jgi:hypothetical protein